MIRSRFSRLVPSIHVQVLGHLGFDFEDEPDASQGAEGKRSPAKRISSRGTSQYLSWGGTSAMSFEVSPEQGRLLRTMVFRSGVRIM